MAPSPSASAAVDPTALLADLRAAAGDDAVEDGAAARWAYSRDLWPKLTVDVRDAVATTEPAAVVRPADEDAVQRTVRAIARHGVPIVPFGSGSGVCGGAAPLYGGVVVDLKRLDHVGAVDAGSLQVTAGPGVILQNLERSLNDAGYTLGHFPSSIFCASLGGAVAARGAGQLSSRYGKIEDMVTGLRLATPSLGLLSTGSLDPMAGATDWTQLFVGSEGTLGLITAIRLRVHPLPATMQLRGVRFPSIGAGITAFREMLQGGLRPSVMRLYDPLDTWMAMQKSNDAGLGPTPLPGAGDPMAGGARTHRPENAAAPNQGARGGESGGNRLFGSVVSPGTVADSVLGRFRRRGRRHRSVEGEGLLSGVKERLIGDRLQELLKPENLPVERLLGNPSLLNKTISLLPGRCLAIFGCEGEPEVAAQHLEATIAAARRLGGVDLGPGPGERWFRTRYHVSFKLPKLLSSGEGFADTFETAVPWTGVQALYDTVRSAVSSHVLVMAHLSHAYHEGCSIYFTLVGWAPTPTARQALYERTWDAALAAALSVGATITHHHGVGVLKRDFMDREHGDARALFEAARQAVDPDRVLNTGKLFPDAVPPAGPVEPDPAPTALEVKHHEDGVVEVGVGWRGVDLAAELSLRGHFLPPLGRDFLEGTVGDWLRSPAVAAHHAVHGAWEHPLLALEGRLADGRRWRSGRLPRSAAGPSYLPFGLGEGPSGVRPVMATLRTLTPPALHPIGFRMPHMDRAVVALGEALRGSLDPLAGTVYPGFDARGYRSVLQDDSSGRDGAMIYLCYLDPDGFPSGSQAVLDQLHAAGGERVSDDDALAWWEDHWAWPAREGGPVMDVTGPLPDDREFGRCAAVVPWRKAVLLLRAVETLTGGATRARGWVEAPKETGCTLRWRFATSRKGGSAPALVQHQLVETIRSAGARLASLRLGGVDAVPDYAFGGRGTPWADGMEADSERIAAAIAEALAGAAGAAGSADAAGDAGSNASDRGKA